MELSSLLLTGSMSGLLSVLAHSVFWSVLELFRGRTATIAALNPPVEISEAVLHLLCGTGLGLLFWLSWGLAAVVDVPWWVRGLSFGGLCWLALTLPAVISLGLSRGMTTLVAAMMASRWATTCLIAGLVCAWNWERSM